MQADMVCGENDFYKRKKENLVIINKYEFKCLYIIPSPQTSIHWAGSLPPSSMSETWRATFRLDLKRLSSRPRHLPSRGTRKVCDLHVKALDVAILLTERSITSDCDRSASCFQNVQFASQRRKRFVIFQTASCHLKACVSLFSLSFLLFSFILLLYHFSPFCPPGTFFSSFNFNLLSGKLFRGFIFLHAIGLWKY